MSLVEQAMAKLRSSETGRSAVDAAQTNVVAGPSNWPGIDSTPQKMIALNHSVLLGAGLAAEPGEERRLADQYRRIKRPILDRVRELSLAKSPFAQLVMLTSALPGDGKTFSSINLAQSIARERDVSVLLVDADVAKPHVSDVLGVDKEPGLLDLLVDATLEVESLVLGTDVPGLRLLPAGRRQETATEFLVSSRMSEVAKLLAAADPRRIVLFDSPPLLLSSESRALIPNVGQVVMMVRAGGTPHGAVMEAIGHIGAEKLTGLVLNQCEMVSTGKHYGYGSYGENYTHTRS